MVLKKEDRHKLIVGKLNAWQDKGEIKQPRKGRYNLSKKKILELCDYIINLEKQLVGEKK